MNTYKMREKFDTIHTAILNGNIKDSVELLKRLPIAARADLLDYLQDDLNQPELARMVARIYVSHYQNLSK